MLGNVGILESRLACTANCRIFGLGDGWNGSTIGTPVFGASVMYSGSEVGKPHARQSEMSSARSMQRLLPAGCGQDIIRSRTTQVVLASLLLHSAALNLAPFRGCRFCIDKSLPRRQPDRLRKAPRPDRSNCGARSPQDLGSSRTRDATLSIHQISCRPTRLRGAGGDRARV